MAEAFRVGPEALAEAVHQVAEFRRYVESMLTEIESLVTNLQATWSGQGAAAHAEAHRHWARGGAMMRLGLAQLQAAGATAQHNYTDARSTNLAMWS